MEGKFVLYFLGYVHQKSSKSFKDCYSKNDQFLLYISFKLMKFSNSPFTFGYANFNKISSV